MKKFKKLSRENMKHVTGGKKLYVSPECGGICKGGEDEPALMCPDGGACPTCSGGVCV